MADSAITTFFSQDTPTCAQAVLWIENELHRRIADVAQVKLAREIQEVLPENGWRNYKHGDKMLFDVTFSDGSSHLLHLYMDGTVCTERPGWYLDHHGIVPLSANSKLCG